MYKLPTLYSRTSKKAVQEWTVEVDGVNGMYRTIHGQVDGKLQETEWTVAKPTNEGRANFRDESEQAIFETNAMWKKKLESGYFEDINDIDKKLYVEPMLAKDWKKRKDKVKLPVFCQRKLDGARCIITKDGAKSRNGKDWATIPHITDAFKEVFERYPDLVLDGELYNHEYKDDFNKIMSLIKRSKPSEEDLKESAENVQYWWYDTASDKHTFSQRSNWIKELKTRFNLPDFIVVVPTDYVKTLEQLDAHYETFLVEGYEGQMIRLDTPYEFKRSSNLLKRKEFIDEEYTILDIQEGDGNKTGYAGNAIMDNGERGTFSTNIAGDRAHLKDLLDNKHLYIGCQGTIRYFNLTPDGVPRFPYLYEVRTYE